MVYPSESWMSVFCTAIYEEILADCWRNRNCETVAHQKSGQKGGNGIRVGMVWVWKKQGEHGKNQHEDFECKRMNTQRVAVKTEGFQGWDLITPDDAPLGFY